MLLHHILLQAPARPILVGVAVSVDATMMSIDAENATPNVALQLHGRRSCRCQSLKYPLKPPLLLGLDDRRIAGFLALTKGRVLAQALPFLRRIDHDPGGWCLAP
jgi:hypothetical protein